jgi:hypothetical protein
MSKIFAHSHFSAVHWHHSSLLFNILSKRNGLNVIPGQSRMDSMTRILKRILYPLTGLLVLLFSGNAFCLDTLEVGKFSAANVENTLPPGWKPLTFKKIEKHTTYTLVKDSDTVVIKAVAEASASGLTREIKINPKEYPIVQWRWKIMNILKKGDVHKKEGDDYPARIYITFEYDPSKLSFFEKAKYKTIRLLYGEYPPLAAINYIWESKAPVGTMVPNPYTDRVMMFVVESGSAKLNQWVNEERNVYEDYKKAFGEEPLMISGVAIMTDTDNTGESATAYYGDIVFKKESKP